jgi:hypothetical protein
MKRSSWVVSGATLLGAFVLEGCSEGTPIPASKSATATRDNVEFPLGPPAYRQNAKAKKGAADAPLNKAVK